MACGCGKYITKGVEQPTIHNMKQCIDWSLTRAKQIAEIREEDMQVYETSNSAWGTYYEIEPINSTRDNIIQIIKWQYQHMQQT